MLTLVIDIGAGVLGGTVSGIATSWVMLRRAKQNSIPAEAFLDHSGITADISGWTTTRGQPNTDELIANKLRLAHALADQQSRRTPPSRWKRWSR